MQLKGLLFLALLLCCAANTYAQQSNCPMTSAPEIAVPADTELCVGQMFTATNAVETTGLPNTEYVITDSNQLASDGGPLILGADADGTFSPTEFGLTAGDDFCVTAVAFDLEQIQNVLEGMLTGTAPPFGSCCTLLDFAFPQFCVNLAAMGITSGSDLEDLNELFLLVDQFSAATTTFSAQSFIDQLNLLNTSAAALPATCGTGGLPLCYAINLNTQACFNVTGMGTLNVSAGPDTEICNGESLTLTATGGTSYLWSTGENTSEINISPSLATVYSVTVADVCASGTDEVSVNVLPSPTSNITIGSNGIFIAEPAGLSYQWYLNAVPISGATDQNFDPQDSGNYSVEVIGANGCSTISEPVSYMVVGVNHIEGVEYFEVFPNPFHDFIDIQIKNDNSETFYVKITDIRGKILQEQEIYSTGNYSTRLNVADLPKGMYFLQIANDKGQLIRKIIK